MSCDYTSWYYWMMTRSGATRQETREGARDEEKSLAQARRARQRRVDARAREKSKLDMKMGVETGLGEQAYACDAEAVALAWSDDAS